jgi:hypothetical protein
MVTQVLLLVSVLLNVVLLLVHWRRTGSVEVKHMHTWTPWTEFHKMEPPPFTYNGKVLFRRVRYCSTCGREQEQEVGEHGCEAVSLHGKHCGHMQEYTAIFDPLYDLKQIDKELKDMEGM